MEELILKDDIKVFYVTAKSFPDGIQQAFIALEKMLSSEGRTFYGISYQNKWGDVIYIAAVSESFEGEAKKYGFETYIISKGRYITKTIINWRKKIETIASSFKNLLAHPLLDKTSACVEWYKSDTEVVCMVKINTSGLN